MLLGRDDINQHWLDFLVHAIKYVNLNMYEWKYNYYYINIFRYTSVYSYIVKYFLICSFIYMEKKDLYPIIQ